MARAWLLSVVVAEQKVKKLSSDDWVLISILVIFTVFTVASFVLPPRWHLGWTGRALPEGALRPGALSSRQGKSSGEVHSLDLSFSLVFFLAMNNCYSFHCGLFLFGCSQLAWLVRGQKLFRENECLPGDSLLCQIRVFSAEG